MSAIDDPEIAACEALPPAGIVDVVTWLSALQMLHRLTRWSEVRVAGPP